MTRFCRCIFSLAALSLLVPAAYAQDAPRAKNVIVMIADGRGYNHILATDLYEHGETGKQVYQQPGFVSLFSSTYSAEGTAGYDPEKAWSDPKYAMGGATDSAAAATAIATGTKTYNAAIGMDLDKKPLRSVVDQAEETGKATGVVSSVPFSHATPAGFVAHNVERDNYKEIAHEMLTQSKVDVIMGTGNPWFDADGKFIATIDEKGVVTTPQPYDYVGGADTWYKLLAGTLANDADGDGDADPWSVVMTREEFQALAEGDTPARVAGVAQAGATLQQERSGDPKADVGAVPLNTNVPTLAEMARGALNVLDNDPDGFFLMVEGGAVDWAAHENQPGRTIEESMDFNRAVEAVVAWVEKNSSWDETLVIVTADHETGALSGPGDTGFIVDVTGNGKGKMPNLQWGKGSHSNSLVPLYAKGPGTSLLEAFADEKDQKHGRYVDNTEIAKTVFQVFGGQPGPHKPAEAAVAAP